MIEFLKNLLYYASSAELSKIKKFRNIHKGEQCYLIGDGVSIKWFDLSRFSDKTAFSLSLIPFHREFHFLQTDYFLLTEPFWFYPSFWTKKISKSVSMPYIQAAYREIIRNNQNKHFFLNLSNYPVVRSKNITYLFRDIFDSDLDDAFISNRINPYQGSLAAAICLSIYMGFDKCYLIGCDYTHSPPRNLHWYEKGDGHYIDLDVYQSDLFTVAKEFIDIYTITLGGGSNTVDSITYEEYTGCIPTFQENDLILESRYMEILDTWHDYTIY